MSEFMTDSKKQEALKDIITKLHKGEDVEAVKHHFHELIKNVSPDEIAAMEQALIDEGMPAEEVQRLCDVHVEVFEKTLGKQKKVSQIPGHPIHTFLNENKTTKKKTKIILKTLKGKPLYFNEEEKNKLRLLILDLKQIEIHYQRKENQLFPYLEKKKFTGPSKVMWGKHDEIREQFKTCLESIKSAELKIIKSETELLVSKIKKMIFMEEKILFPTAGRKLEEREWALIRRGEAEIGYAWIKPGNLWDSDIVLHKSMAINISTITKNISSTPQGISLDVGHLNPDQINLLLKALPLDITYADKNDEVLYYTGSDERVFPRSPGIIGRKVQNCHPPESMHIVDKILTAFKSGEKKEAEFWIHMSELFVHIRYFALYNSSSEYEGCIEVTQEITKIQSLKGDRRLLDW